MLSFHLDAKVAVYLNQKIMVNHENKSAFFKETIYSGGTKGSEFLSEKYLDQKKPSCLT